MFIKAPFLIPYDFLREFSYPGPRRFIAFYWTPLGDDVFRPELWSHELPNSRCMNLAS